MYSLSTRVFIVEILYVDGHESTAFGGDDGVKETLSGGEAGHASGSRSRVVEAVPSDGEAHSVFFCLAGTEGGN